MAGEKINYSGNEKGTPASGTSALRHAQDVKHGGSPEALLRTMMNMLERRGGELEAKEEAEFIPLIRQITQRAEILVRQNLAKQVSALPIAPRGLLEFLALDEIEVAEPLLTNSPAFGDDLLIEVIDEKGGDHAATIAGRPQVSKTVSNAIIGSGLEQAILALLRNSGAEIEKTAFARLQEKARGNGLMQQAMIKRDDLPVIIAQQIFWIARGGLRQQILERFSIRPGQLDILLEQAVSDGLADPEIIRLRKEIQQSITPPNASSRMPVSQIIEHIKAGHIAEFVKGVSSYLAVRKSSIEHILNDEGGEPLAVLCRALDADRMQFTSVLLQNDYRRFGMPRPPGQIEHVSRIYDCITTDNALATLQMWDALDTQIAA